MKKLTDYQKNFLYVLRHKTNKADFIKITTDRHIYTKLDNAMYFSYGNALGQKERLVSEELDIVKLCTALEQAKDSKSLSTH